METEVKQKVKMYALKDSHIEKLGYDETTETLYLAFKGNKHYSYAGVGKETYESLYKAPSVGTFFGANIRNLPTKKLTEQETIELCADIIELHERYVK